MWDGIKRIEQFVAGEIEKLFGTHNPQQTKLQKELEIINRIHYEARTLLNGYERWKNNEEMGLRYLYVIHESKEGVNKSGDKELLARIDDNLRHINIVEYNFQSIINDVVRFKLYVDAFKDEQKAIPGVKEDDPLLKRLNSMIKFSNKLIELYERDLRIKRRVIQGISYTVSTDDSYILMASWDSLNGLNDLSGLITQLLVADTNLLWDL